MAPDTHYVIVHFSGHVQGVGFRYTTLQVAKEFEVCGWVSNLSDGRVLLEAEGTASELKAFVAAVGERLHGYIRKIEEKSGRRQASLQGFQIK